MDNKDDRERFAFTQSWESKGVSTGRMRVGNTNERSLKELAKALPNIDMSFSDMDMGELTIEDHGQVRPVVYNPYDIDLNSTVDFNVHTLRFDSATQEVKYTVETLRGLYRTNAYVVKTSMYGLAIYKTSPSVENPTNSMWVARIAGELSEKDATDLLAIEILRSIETLRNSWTKIVDEAARLLGATQGADIDQAEELASSIMSSLPVVYRKTGNNVWDSLLYAKGCLEKEGDIEHE